MKISIVGAGVAGLSLAWALAKRGHLVTVYDQGPIPNPLSSSHDEHRIFRHAYGTSAHYAKLMPEALQLWEQLWRETGVCRYEPIGAVYFIRETTPWYSASTATLNEMGIGYRDIALAEAGVRFPMINPEGLTRVVETEGAGVLLAALILNDLIMLLARMGVALHAYSPVAEIDPEHARILVNDNWLEADLVVVAAGAWVDRLVPELRREVLPSRQSVLYLAPPPRFAEAWSNAPVLVDTSERSGTYALPPRFGARLKIGDHIFTRQGDANDSRLATDSDLERLRGAIKASYRDSDSYAEIERKSCYYTVEEKERFIVREIGRAGFVISACSGHGFKLQPLVADYLARAINGECDTATAAARIAGIPA